MNRLQKKCFIASASAHLFLALLLVLGPGFISSRSKSADDMPILDFTPFKTVDQLISGGGNPNAKPPPAAPAPQPPAPAPAPQPQQEKLREPEPPKEPVREVKPPKTEEESLEPSKKKIEISTKLVSRNQEDKSEAKARAEEKARDDAKRAADARRRLARQLGQAAERISSEVSGGTSLKLDYGPGGGGAPYANFNQAVMSVYKRAWSGTVPNDSTEENVSAEASVTIARDGSVISARITRSSGKTAVDRSVQAVLDRVKYAAPLPDDAKESQRTVSITFEVNPHQGIG